MKERTIYQRQMDEVRLREDKKKETLRLLLEENQRLREAEEKKAAKKNKVFSWKIPSMAMAAVACLVLVVVGFSGRGGISFESIRLRDLPQIGSRGETEALSFSEAFGKSPESLFSAGSITEGKTEIVYLTEERHYRGSLEILINGSSLAVSVTDYEPPIYTATKKTQEINGVKVRLAEDTGLGRKCCVYEREGMYVTLSSDTLSQGDFVNAVQSVIKK